MRFIKFHGFGNDYIVFHADEVSAVKDIQNFGRRVCNRHYGAGADGITVVKPAADKARADWEIEIINPDGSFAGLSGNGTRCAVAFLYYQKLWDKPELRLQTRSGVKLYTLRETLAHGHYWFESELGKPAFDSSSVPILTDVPQSTVVGFPLTVAGEKIKLTALLLGNPNSVIFVENFDALDWRSVGSELETHALFPDRTNVTFVKPLDRHNIEVRIWERAAGETFSSGTCSSAAVVASVINGYTERDVRVHTPGGLIEVHWRDSNDEVVLTGRADIVYAGDWIEEASKI